MKQIVRTLLSVALVLTLALPAHAAVYDFGSKTCSTWYQVAIRSYSSGYTVHEMWEPYYIHTGSWNNGSSMKVRVSYSFIQSGQWWVSVDGGALNDPGTYGWCAPDFE